MGGNSQLLTLGIGLLFTAIAATYVTRLAKVLTFSDASHTDIDTDEWQSTNEDSRFGIICMCACFVSLFACAFVLSTSAVASGFCFSVSTVVLTTNCLFSLCFQDAVKEIDE